MNSTCQTLGWVEIRPPGPTTVRVERSENYAIVT